MATRQKTAELGADAAVQAASEFSSMLNDAAARSYRMVETGATAWSDETRRYFDELSKQSQSVIEQLKACRSPLDVLSVEQAWVAARSKAYLESGLRFAQIFANIAQTQTETPAAAE